jgi:hypothetical protein
MDGLTLVKGLVIEVGQGGGEIYAVEWTLVIPERMPAGERRSSIRPRQVKCEREPAEPPGQIECL